LSFAEPRFLLFLPAALICYFASPKRVRPYTLLAASLVFYWFAGGVFALLVISATAVTVYLTALRLGALRRSDAPKRRRKAPLAACLALNFGLLFLFRYSGRLIPSLGLLLIPGISFYTFQSAGYLIDAYRGKLEPERNILKLALFISFFPQLVIGPISRHSQIADDLFAGHGWNWERARGGISRIIWGYFLKLVIADYAAVPVNAVISSYQNYGGAVIAFAVLLYSFQLYADFAGGISIAIGVGKLVGVTMPENFAQPFFARSLTDYWRRWHITLGAWLRDYLFYSLALSKPLGRLGRVTRRAFGANLGKMIPASVATFAVYIVMAVWHGLSFKTLAYGLLNGGLITLSLYFGPFWEKLRRVTKLDGGRGFGAVFATVRTFVLVVFLRYFARAVSLRAALSMLKRTLLRFEPRALLDGTLGTLGLTAGEYATLAAAIVLLLARDAVAERAVKLGSNFESRLASARPAAQFLLTAAVLALIVYCGVYREGYIASQFIYAQY
jgi:D-alanyl-lipoteichoic acid acyltransferase DltB (MBOAT superfamily)